MVLVSQLFVSTNIVKGKLIVRLTISREVGTDPIALIETTLWLSAIGFLLRKNARFLWNRLRKKLVP